MKKMVMGFLVLLLSISSLFQSVVSYASESATSEVEEVIIERSQEEIYKEEQAAIRLLTTSGLERTPIYEYKIEQVGAPQIARKVQIGFADNQPIGGTVFASPEGFYWTESGSTGSVTFAVGYGMFSLGVTPGKVGGTGSYIQSPYVNLPCKLMVHKDIQVTKYKEYRKYVMGDGSWEYIGDIYTKIPTVTYLSVVRV